MDNATNNTANSATTVDNIRNPRAADAPVGWGAALIDDQGNEVPITESMIRRACEELSRTWTFPAMQSTGRC